MSSAVAACVPLRVRVRVEGAAAPAFVRTPYSAALLWVVTLPLTSYARAPAPDAAPSSAEMVLAQATPVQLDTVVVKATPDAGDDYQQDSANLGRLSAPLRDIPQTVTVVPRAVLDAQNATTLTDALRNVPGITLSSGEGGQIGDNVNLRGFTARTDFFLDGLRDRGQYRRDTFALESVEVLKGPSSLYFGRGSTGGVINQVSKLPLAVNLSQVTASVGTDDYYRTTADFNRVLSPTASARVALVAQDIRSTRDVVENQDFGIAPSLRVALAPDTDLTLFGLVQHNRDIPDYGIPFLGTRPAEVDVDRFYGNTDDSFDQDVYVARAKVEHRFSPTLRVQNQVQYNRTDLVADPTPYRVCTTAFNNAGTAPTGPCPVAPAGASYDQINVQSDRRDRELRDTSLFNQLDLFADFATFGIKHSVLAGVEIGRDTTSNQAYTNTRQLQTLGGFTPMPTPGTVTRTRAATYVEGEATTVGVYVNDTVSLLPQLKAVVGVRRDRFDAEVRTVVNATGATANQANGQPNAFERTDYGTGLRGGLIFQPSLKQSYYLSYGSSFNPSAEAITISAAQSTVGPEKTNSYEVGAKWDLLDQKLSLSTAVFRVQKDDARTTDALGIVTVDGETRVQGVEFGAVGRLTRNWQLIGGYTYLDSELVETNDGVGTGAARVSFEGNALPNAPMHSASLWTTYRFLRDYEIGGGAFYVGDRFVTTANTTNVDSYIRADALVAWHRPLFDLQLNVQNVADEDFYDGIIASENGRAVPGRGRTFIATGSVRFGGGATGNSGGDSTAGAGEGR